MASPAPILRHRTAIRRAGVSLPIKCALRDGLLGPGCSLFDYGCGRGQDLELVREQAIPCEGWDPVHRPGVPHRSADVVNLGYVINVIEAPRERAEVLTRAWALAGGVLIVAAQLEGSSPGRPLREYEDGVVTSRGTFQKYYRQAELREYLATVLGQEPIPAAPGVFYVFKDDTAREGFLARRYRRAMAVPRQRVSEALFERHRELLQALMERLTDLGRLPEAGEFPLSKEIEAQLGSLKRAFAIIRRVTDEAPWVEIAQRRREDLLVYLALARFGRRPPLGRLTPATQHDVKAFFRTYSAACRQADDLLFGISDPGAVDAACRPAPVGRLVDNALILHRSALDRLDPLLRIYEGCARALVGDIDEANLIKLHRSSGKVSYLAYPDFDTEAHPTLALRVKVSLRTLDVDVFDYATWDDGYILYRKDLLVPPGYPQHAAFKHLSDQEERIGLLRLEERLDTSAKLTRCLAASGLRLVGHSIQRAQEA